MRRIFCILEMQSMRLFLLFSMGRLGKEMDDKKSCQNGIDK